MERFHVSGIPEVTQSTDFLAVIEPYGEGHLVASKLAPNECRGFGYITINKKKRSEVLKRLRERFGSEVALHKPKEDPRALTLDQQQQPNDCKKPATTSPPDSTPQHGSRQSRLTLGHSKKLRTFDSDEEDETYHREGEEIQPKKRVKLLDENEQKIKANTPKRRKHSSTQNEILPATEKTPVPSAPRDDSDSEEKVAAVNKDEVERQKGILFSLFPSMTQKKQPISSLIVPRFDPTACPSSSSKEPAVTVACPSKEEVERENTPTMEKARKDHSGEAEVLKPTKTLTSSVPSKSIVNPLFKNVFRNDKPTESNSINGKPIESFTRDDKPAESTSTSAIADCCASGDQDSRQMDAIGQPNIDVSSASLTVTPENWINSMVGIQKPKKEVVPVPEVKLVELLPFWRRTSEKEIREAWMANKSWYSWDLKSKHRRQLRVKTKSTKMD